MSDDPYDDRPLSEIYRLVSKKWVEAEAVANLLEETKSHVLQRMAQDLVSKFDISGAEAERRVRSTIEWKEWVEAMCEARKEALRYKCQLEYIRIRHSEQQSAEATQRAERRL